MSNESLYSKHSTQELEKLLATVDGSELESITGELIKRYRAHYVKLADGSDNNGSPPSRIRKRIIIGQGWLTPLLRIILFVAAFLVILRILIGYPKIFRVIIDFLAQLKV